MPQAIAMALFMPVSGRLFDKIGVIPLGLSGLLLLSTMTYELHKLTVDTPHDWLITVLVLRGIGISLCMMPLSTAGMNAVNPRQVGNASSLSNLIRQVAGSMAIAILTMIMQKRAAAHTSHIADTITLSNPAVSNMGNSSSLSMDTIGSLIQLEATTRGISDTFWVSALPLFFCIPLVFFFKLSKKKPQGN